MNALRTKLIAKRDSIVEDEGGFTLIELLVVVLIIAVLAAIAVPVYLGIQSQAIGSAATADLANIKTAIVAETVGGSFPASVAGLSSITLNEANWNTDPAFVGAANITDGFCVEGEAANGQDYFVTDATAPAEGTCTAPAGGDDD